MGQFTHTMLVDFGDALSVDAAAAGACAGGAAWIGAGVVGWACTGTVLNHRGRGRHHLSAAPTKALSVPASPVRKSNQKGRSKS